MGRSAPVCKICRQRPATVPDRDKFRAIFRRAVCRECHAARLQGDLLEIVEHISRQRDENQTGKGGGES